MISSLCRLARTNTLARRRRLRYATQLQAEAKKYATRRPSCCPPALLSSTYAFDRLLPSLPRCELFSSSSSSSSSAPTTYNATPTINKKFSIRRRLAAATRKAHELLLDETRDPLGSYKAYHYQLAREIVTLFMQIAKDLEHVKLCLAIMERVAQEVPVASNENLQFSSWILLRTYFPLLLQKWTSESDSSSPKALLQKLQTLSRQFNAVTIGNIMDVITKQSHPSVAPILAQGFLDFLKNEAEKTQNSQLEPHVHIYNQVLHAWAKSGHPDTATKMDAFVEDMRDDKSGVALTVVTYNILLRYWGGRGSTARIEELLEDMKKDGVKPLITTLSQAIYGYAQVGCTDKAEELLDRMVRRPELQQQNDNAAAKTRDVVFVGESTQNILVAYRRTLDTKAADWAKERAVVRATRLFKKMQEKVTFDEDQKSKFLLSIFLACLRTRGIIEKLIDIILTTRTTRNGGFSHCAIASSCHQFR